MAFAFSFAIKHVTVLVIFSIVLFRLHEDIATIAIRSSRIFGIFINSINYEPLVRLVVFIDLQIIVLEFIRLTCFDGWNMLQWVVYEKLIHLIKCVGLCVCFLFHSVSAAGKLTSIYIWNCSLFIFCCLIVLMFRRWGNFRRWISVCYSYSGRDWRVS